jgi:hypothetical protein
LAARSQHLGQAGVSFDVLARMPGTQICLGKRKQQLAGIRKVELIQCCLCLLDIPRSSVLDGDLA